jgi:predicted GNAT superfamily acetyltransferase
MMADPASLPAFMRYVDDNIIIRRAESPADYRACQDVQRGAWGIAEEGYIVPIATLVGANLHGGMVLGAFQPDGQAVGFSFGFLGRIEGRLCLYSQLTGVLPAFQSRGLGHAIKLAQRDLARAEGLGKIVWAFDPLQAGNAFFNLHRLGAYARRYIENMYGPRTDALNAGVPTDRLIAEWDINVGLAETRPVTVLDVSSLPRLIEVEGDPVLLVPVRVNSEVGTDPVLLEIPGQIAELRRHHPLLAEAWRKSVRQAFEAVFAKGFRANGFARDDASGHRRCYYVLEREAALDG